ncbi:DeoR/GlpR family DNA-binding transcription regulator [Acuticoccus sp. I52.16.1]|uniref:DeoR/GlpR family DNA-binding transcription regulator n=1 Tax=Acuticoccus sp. I52.16.1 TaxID=2928472 RepID=UPI001FD33906|nr:DeoR/GlpR family DNA-binding transcription regulator [Acuticoccus sp. I52.16.1]UOM36232.1 DeoR/GlpR family DNA-binding transcription regulator [Acuticoccus sp. I52.16.1]
MSDLERQQSIVELLSSQTFVSVRDLQQTLGVSAATVRRDIDKLNEAGVARKVYGGVAALEDNLWRRPPSALPFVENRDLAVEQKRAIAAAAEGLVRDGSSVIVHAGSTCFTFGCRLALRNVRVFTNSMPLAAYLAEHGTCHLTVGGGDIHREPGILFDPVPGPTHYAAQFYVGALGVSGEGILEQHPLLVRFVKEMSERANEIIVLVDSSKFALRPPVVALPMSRITTLVTDDGITPAHERMVREEGVNLIVAETSARPQ